MPLPACTERLLVLNPIKAYLVKIRPFQKIMLLSALMLLIWSLLFAFTYRYPFFWDDLHLIRPYSGAEIQSTFHGPNDPDKIETPALRPIATLLFCFQGNVFGENLLMQRVFMICLMAAFLFALGLLLLELGFHISHITLIFMLFIASRVFASLMLWITLGTLIFSYIFTVLAVYFFLRWLKTEHLTFFILSLLCVLVSVFTREEIYVLPILLLITGVVLKKIGIPIARSRLIAGSASIFLIIVAHYYLRNIFISKAPLPKLNWSTGGGFLLTIYSSLMPCGFQFSGHVDRIIQLLWRGFLIVLVLLFVRISRKNSLMQFFGACGVGLLFCLPSFVIPRSFGIAMPTLAFMAAISIAIIEIFHQVRFVNSGKRYRQYAIVAFLISGLVIGVGGGINRSMKTADSLRDNCVKRVIRDGMFLFDLYKRPPTIPIKRRLAGLSRLSALGIRSAEDIRNLMVAVEQDRESYVKNNKARTTLFLSKYDYLSF